MLLVWVVEGWGQRKTVVDGRGLESEGFYLSSHSLITALDMYFRATSFEIRGAGK